MNFTDTMHKKDMQNHSHIYAQYLGAAGGNGLGIRLLLNSLKDLKKENIPIYFWTVNPENEKMYHKLGFQALGVMRDPKSGIEFWRFLYNPNTQNVMENTTNSVQSAVQRVLK